MRHLAKQRRYFTGNYVPFSNPGLISSILSVMGFAYVMKLTKCDRHLVQLVAGGLSKVRFALIPGATIATFAINIALTSAAGVSAAVGAIFIPVMMAAGIHPAVAAAAVLAGTFGSVMSPANTHTNIIAKMAKVSPVDVAAVVTGPTIVAGLIGAITLAIVAYILKEDRGYQSQTVAQNEAIEVNYLKALIPFVPLILLILGNQPQFKSWSMTVPASMLIGTMLAMLVSMTSPVEVTKSFFEGMGKAYADIMGIIITAGVFTAGLKVVGLIDALLNGMNGVKSAVGLAGTLGPMLVAILSGSGDAATIAFNDAVTPHAATFGLTMEHLGMLASLAGAIGRSMSPVAGACIVVSGIAGANPVEVAKRNMPGMIIAAIVVFLWMGL